MQDLSGLDGNEGRLTEWIMSVRSWWILATRRGKDSSQVQLIRWVSVSWGDGNEQTQGGGGRSTERPNKLFVEKQAYVLRANSNSLFFRVSFE